MFDSISQINPIAVLLAVLASALLGGVYFGALVPKAYLRVLGRTEAPKPTPLAMVGPVVCSAAVVLTSAVLISALELSTVAEALEFTVVVGVGYLLAMTFQIAINPNFPHPLRYGLLNAPYFMLLALSSSLLLTLL